MIVVVYVYILSRSHSLSADAHLVYLHLCYSNVAAEEPEFAVENDCDLLRLTSSNVF